jgi:hypothetical protein
LHHENKIIAPDLTDLSNKEDVEIVKPRKRQGNKKK